MRTSEALTQFYFRIYDTTPDEMVLESNRKTAFNLFAQAPEQGREILTRWMFEVPAYYYLLKEKEPEKARDALLKAIAGSEAWEMILEIDDASPTAEQFTRYLEQIGFFDQFNLDQ